MGTLSYTKVDHHGRIWIGWDDPEDAIEVSYVIQNAGMKDGKITDRGFYDDGVSLFEIACKEQENRA
jgi:hypothetical protein